MKCVRTGVMLLTFCFALSTQTLIGDEFDHEPINYSTTQPNDCIARLQKRIDEGSARLEAKGTQGYLASVLKELNVPVSSQMLVYSKTSLQRHRIAPDTPRALYFNDDVYIGYCQNGDVLEVSAVDPQLGTIFYTLDQQVSDQPRFARQTDSCLLCHSSTQAQNIPGHLVRSVYSDPAGFPILSSGSFRIDQTSPIEKRWGGWYVTGEHGTQKHLGNLIVRGKQQPEEIDNSSGQNVTDLSQLLEVDAYLTGHSDIVALMVFEHQTMAHNLLTRANFVTRQALHYEATLNRELKEAPGHRWASTLSRIKSVGEPLVQYLLCSNEAPLKSAIQGTSGYADEFMKAGPRDSRGRSLRDLDLKTRLFKYPCSYLIYSPSFEQLPKDVREFVLDRLWNVLQGRDQSKEFAHLSQADRTAIREILIETLPNLPEYWDD